VLGQVWHPKFSVTGTVPVPADPQAPEMFLTAHKVREQATTRHAIACTLHHGYTVMPLH
jgi:hypothetical protein